MPFCVVAGILVLDQASKFFITSNLSLHQSTPLIRGILHLTLVHNRGAAFGILRNQAPLFIITSLCAIILIVRDLKNSAHHFIYKTALSLILGGALGNLIDRVCWGHVVDFIDFRVWPVFNVADSAITIGVCLLGYSILRKKTA